MKSIPVVILVRVSTSAQETDRQKFELTSYAAKEGYQVVKVIEESISGTSTKENRTGLQQVEEMARRGEIKKVLVHEISRVARKNSVAHQFLETLEEYGVSLYWHQHRIETLLPNGKRNPAASIMFSLLAELGREERETLVSRIKSGIENSRRRGVQIGRPKGSTESDADILGKHKDIIKLLNRGVSIRHIASLTSKSTTTVQKVKKLHSQKGVSHA